MLLHIIDAAAVDGRDPITDYEQINTELERYNPRLIRLPQLIVFNKIDLPDAQTQFATSQRLLRETTCFSGLCSYRRWDSWAH